MIGDADFDGLEIHFSVFLADHVWLCNPQCVLIQQIGTRDQRGFRYIIADTGRIDNGGGVRSVDSSNLSVLHMQTVQAPKSNPYGISVDADGRLHVTFRDPRDRQQNVCIISNPFDESPNVLYCIGIPEDVGDITADGPYEYASTIGAGCIACFGYSSFVIYLPNKTNFICCTWNEII